MRPLYLRFLFTTVLSRESGAWVVLLSFPAPGVDSWSQSIIINVQMSHVIRRGRSMGQYGNGLVVSFSSEGKKSKQP